MAPGAPLGHRLRLIVITDSAAAAPGSVIDVVAAALAAGAPAVQLRDKGADAAELLERGGELRRMTRRAGALLFVNDRVDLALALEADGVHLGPDDLPVADVRRDVADRLLIGYSTDDPDDARRAVAAGADYVGCGAVYPTGSKADAGAVIGLARLDEVARAVMVPVVGIGGINPARAVEVARTAAAGVAVIGAVMAARDPAAAVAALLAPFRNRNRGSS